MVNGNMDNTIRLETKAVQCLCGMKLGSFTEIDNFTGRVMVELREEAFSDGVASRFLWSNHRCDHWTAPLFMSEGVPILPETSDVVRKELFRLSLKVRL